MIDFAHEHAKPLMIAESAPKQYFAPVLADAWTGWYEPVFRSIKQNGIKAFCYINQDWNTQAMWRASSACNQGSDWGDTRVEAAGSTILDRWKHAVRSNRFLSAGPQLYREIRFTAAEVK